MVDYKDKLSFVVADIPGLIEGASDGIGLGLQFLRHVERCRVLVHLVDLSAVVEGRDPVHDFDVLNRELAKYSPTLAQKPQIVVANKLDLPDAREALPAFEAAMLKRGARVLHLSGATGEGQQALLDACARVLFAKAPEKMRLKGRHGDALLVTAEEALAAAGLKRPKVARKPAPAKSAKAAPAKRPPATKATPPKPAPKAKAPRKAPPQKVTPVRTGRGRR